MTEQNSKPDFSQNAFCRLTGCRYPIIAGPMFLVSDENLVVAVSEAGALGAMPSLNWRKAADFRAAVQNVKSRTRNPFAVNLIVNQSNIRLKEDLKICVEEKVPVIITSLGNPAETIQSMHAVGSKVFCDVTNLDYARKVEKAGADGLIAVTAGAGGHAGPISPLVLIPYLKKNTGLPVIAAGGIALGSQMAASMVLGADAVQIGTRFIATHEAKVDSAYKTAIVKAGAEDIVMTEKLSGTPCSVINTPYVKKMGLNVNPLERFLLKNSKTKKYVKLARSLIGAKALEKAALLPTYREVWCAGQSVGLIDEIVSCREVIDQLIVEYFTALNAQHKPLS